VSDEKCPLTRVKYDGPGDTSLLLAHPLFGSAQEWDASATLLAERRPVIAVDMRNHGKSPWFNTHSYLELADDLAATIDDPTDVLGHSMGGKASMLLALEQPQLVRRLIVVDVAPASYRNDICSFLGHLQKVDFSRVTKPADVFDQLPRTIPPQSMENFLRNVDIQERRWRFNLEALATHVSEIMGFPKVTRQFHGPVLFVVPQRSDEVTRHDVSEIKRLFPSAEFIHVPQATGWLHVDDPKGFIDIVNDFLG